jgi:hypothetical protein
MLAKVFKLRCQRCGTEHFVDASRAKPGLLLFVCPACGTHHALVLDSNLDLRDLRVVEEIEVMPAGVYEVADADAAPETLREVLLRAGSASDERLRSAINLAKRLGLLRVVG